MVKGYKVFRPDWMCRDKQYTCPGTFAEQGELIPCYHGMHFCKKASDCFNYYAFDPDNHVAEVIAHGAVIEEGDKCCTNALEIVREIPWSEVLEIVNHGKANSGLCNTGNRNTGNRNTGDWNTGNRNTGDWNTGDWNASSFSSGCFNTVDPSNILMFNKPSPWTLKDWWDSDARYYLNQIPKNVVEWVISDRMTDEEKAKYPEHETTGGYLKKLDESACAQIWWDGSPDYVRDIIKSLPNFDPVVFENCTGIKIEN